MRVLVRPCYPDYLKNRLFDVGDEVAGHWLLPFRTVREKLTGRGIDLATIDMHPLESADVIVLVDLPYARHQFEEIRAKAPQAKLVLQILETPLDRLHFLYPPNHELFDAVITYTPELAARGGKYLRYYLPVARAAADDLNIPFASRRPLVLLNSNRFRGWRQFRQRGWSGLQVVGPMLSGWSCPLWLTMRQGNGSLYERRRRLARCSDRYADPPMDVFGPGWNGERMSWLHRFFPQRKYRSAKGSRRGDKLNLFSGYKFGLAFENMIGTVGYVSEKLFDCYFAGCVPIYLGEEKITDYVPADSFVDARQFKSDRELLEYTLNCPEADWAKIRDAGQRFIHSPAFEKFLPTALAEAWMTALDRVTAGVPN